MAKLINCEWKPFDMWPSPDKGKYIVTLNDKRELEIFELDNEEINGKPGIMVPNTGMSINDFIDTEDFNYIYWDYLTND